MISMNEVVSSFVYESTHQVEETITIAVRLHCTDDSKGKYAPWVNVYDQGVLIGTWDMEEFLREVNSQLAS